MKLHLKILLVLIPLIVAPLVLVGIVAYDRLRANSEKVVLQQMNNVLGHIEENINTNLTTALSNIEFFSNSELLRKYITTEDEAFRYDILQRSILKLFATYNSTYPDYYEFRVIMPDGYEDVRFTPTVTRNVLEEEGTSQFFINMKNSPEKVNSFLYKNPDNEEYAYLVSKKMFYDKIEEAYVEGGNNLRGYLAVTVNPSFIKRQLESERIGKEGFLFVTDEKGTVLFHPTERDVGVGAELPKPLFSQLLNSVRSASSTKGRFLESDYIFQGRKLESGTYVFGALPISELMEASEGIQKLVLTILLLTIVVTAFLVYGVSRYFIINPIQKLVDATRLIGQGKLDVRLEVESRDEIGQLAADFNQMAEDMEKSHEELRNYSLALEQKVEERTATLREKNDELIRTLDELKAAQDHLVQSEKMVFLGELVAGVAHEINTPIGIGVTSASYLSERTEETIQKFDENDLRKSTLEKYLDDCKQSSNLILRNLNRTSSLIQSFKMVSADQTYDEVRTFNVKEYICNILQSLEPKTRKTPHVFEVKGDVGINAHNNPGALAQVITNLVLNSLFHAYEEERVGNITIDVSRNGEHATVIYSDDGKGIPKEHIGKIFNPFFTTKRNQGGTGLGLHVVYNIVHKTLGGKIHCESELGKGTKFSIEFPLKNVTYRRSEAS